MNNSMPLLGRRHVDARSPCDDSSILVAMILRVVGSAFAVPRNVCDIVKRPFFDGNFICLFHLLAAFRIRTFARCDFNSGVSIGSSVLDRKDKVPLDNDYTEFSIILGSPNITAKRFVRPSAIAIRTMDRGCLISSDSSINPRDCAHVVPPALVEIHNSCDAF